MLTDNMPMVALGSIFCLKTDNVRTTSIVKIMIVFGILLGKSDDEISVCGSQACRVIPLKVVSLPVM